MDFEKRIREQQLLDKLQIVKSVDQDLARFQIDYDIMKGKMGIPYSKAGGEVDEKWIALKEKYDNYYDSNSDRWTSKQTFSHLDKVDDHTYHFTVGDVGKKKSSRETLADLFSVSPPSEINGFKLVGIVNNEGEVNSSAYVRTRMQATTNNEYSEYENNIQVTYKYVKK